MSDGEEERKVGFLRLPVELIDGFVLPNLDWNDLLRFRRVCKWTNEITSGYLKVHPELAPEIQIDEEGEKNLRAFLKLGIPSERIFLNNLSGDEFYQNLGTDGAIFLEQFGPHVKQLRVAQMSRYMYGEERKFLDSLSNLESFKAGHFGYGRKVGESEIEGVLARKHELMVEDPGSDGGTIWFPMIFKKLKNLKISHDKNMVFGGDFLVYKEPLICSASVWTKLETVMLPMNLKDASFLNGDRVIIQPLLWIAINQFISSVAKREAANQWKTFDFGGFYRTVGLEQTRDDSNAFLELCEICNTNDVKLLNVRASWFQARIPPPRRIGCTACRRHALAAGRQVPPVPPPPVVRDSPLLGIPVVSMVNIVPCVLPLDLENLEKLEIRETSLSTPGKYWIQHRREFWTRDRREWPALKAMDITVNSKHGHCLSDSTATKVLFQFLFEDIRRPAMEELRLNFTREALEAYVPCVEDIVAACPNLKKLTIIKWPGGSEDMIKLWKGLENLEELHLESCKFLDDSAFLGEDETTPVFLKLTKLKSFTFKRMDMMPNVTDKLFTTVIRKMSLKRLILSSDQPLESVTLGGVQSLLKGRFADSIEKFPFQDWSLEGVSEKKFRDLETEFRSYNML